MSKAEDLVDALADLIAEKVAAKLGGTPVSKKPSIPAEADPPDVKDKGDDDVAEDNSEAEKPARRTRKSAKAAKKTEKEEEDDTDMPTPEQLDLVTEECEAYDLEQAKSDLLDYYISQGHTKKSASTQIAEADTEELRAAFVDYSARLLALQDDDSYDFIEDFDECYKAERVIGGETKVFWVKYATTLTADEVKAEKLEVVSGYGDEEEEEEEEEEAPKKKRTRRTKA